MALKSFQFKVETIGQAVEALPENISVTVNAKVTLEEKITLLFEAESEGVFRYLASVFGNSAAEELEDVTQDVFIKLYHCLQAGDRIENYRSWLFRVAHNGAIDRLRHQKFVTLVDEIKWEELSEQMPDPALNPEQLALKFEEMSLLHNAVKRLTLQERQCLHLRVEGFRYREIAEILGIGIPTASEYLRRAMKKLMNEFGSE